MFGLGKKKVDQHQFELELVALIKVYRIWGGGDAPPPALISQLKEFKKVVPDDQISHALAHTICELIDNQAKAMSHLAVAISKSPSDLYGGAKEMRIGQGHMDKTNMAAEILVGQVEALDESSPMRKLLIDHGMYDPGGEEVNRKSKALDLLRVLQWCTTRQQLSLEEWNDALALETGGMAGDELYKPPTFNLTSKNAPRLLPVAERRLACARLVRNEFARLTSGSPAGYVGEAVDAWHRVFEIHLRRCEITVANLRWLIDGTNPSDQTDSALVPEESRLMNEAVTAQQTVMQVFEISPDELQYMMLSACNDLRQEQGKAPLSIDQYRQLTESGLAGQRPRYFA